MTRVPSPSEKRRRRQIGRALIMLVVLAMGMAAFALRAFHVGRAAPTIPPVTSSELSQVGYDEVEIEFGRGYIGRGWRVYFNEPDGGRGRADYADGLDEALAAAIELATATLDIAAFELNSDAMRAAIAAAQERGVRVRMVTDDEHGLRDERDAHLRDLQAAGVAMRADGRSGLMHNKFVIIDQRRVWTGSMNFTVNGSYRNNNNVLALESAAVAAAYQAEFDEMFERGEFGKRSSDEGPITLALGDGEIRIIFGSEADEIEALVSEIGRARESIRFMTFVFSLADLAEAMLLQAANADVMIEGIFERRNSTASWSQLPALHCNGAALRQDGNRYVLHHKVIIIDNDTVITGSFNFSGSAAESNDENIVIIRHADIAALYLDEWRRIWDSATELAPDAVICD